MLGRHSTVGTDMNCSKAKGDSRLVVIYLGFFVICVVNPVLLFWRTAYFSVWKQQCTRSSNKPECLVVSCGRVARRKQQQT